MTAAEACALLAETMCVLSAARAERESYRLVAVRAVHDLRDRHVELENLQQRYRQVLDEARRFRVAALSSEMEPTA